jgi:hypothetical protein
MAGKSRWMSAKLRCEDKENVMIQHAFNPFKCSSNITTLGTLGYRNDKIGQISSIFATGKTTHGITNQGLFKYVFLPNCNDDQDTPIACYHD